MWTTRIATLLAAIGANATHIYLHALSVGGWAEFVRQLARGYKLTACFSCTVKSDIFTFVFWYGGPFYLLVIAAFATRAMPPIVATLLSVVGLGLLDVAWYFNENSRDWYVVLSPILLGGIATVGLVVLLIAGHAGKRATTQVIAAAASVPTVGEIAPPPIKALVHISTRPAQVTWAVRALWIAFFASVLGVIPTLLTYMSRKEPPYFEMSIWLVSGVLIVAWASVIYLVGRRHNWARILILISLGFRLFSLFDFAHFADLRTVGFVANALDAALSAFAVYWLFTGEGAQWFKTA